MVPLAEWADPSEGWKKWVRTPKEGDAREPITAVPLRAAGATNVGSDSCARVDTAGSPTKRATPDTPERVASNHLSGSSSSTGVLLHAMVGMAGPTGRDPAGVVEGVVSSFGITGLPLEVSSKTSTPSCV